MLRWPFLCHGLPFFFIIIIFFCNPSLWLAVQCFFLYFCVRFCVCLVIIAKNGIAYGCTFQFPYHAFYHILNGGSMIRWKMVGKWRHLACPSHPFAGWLKLVRLLIHFMGTIFFFNNIQKCKKKNTQKIPSIILKRNVRLGRSPCSALHSRNRM